MAEKRGDFERERETWIIPARLNGVDRLARDAQFLGKLGLRELVASTEDTEFVLH